MLMLLPASTRVQLLWDRSVNPSTSPSDPGLKSAAFTPQNSGTGQQHKSLIPKLHQQLPGSMQNVRGVQYFGSTRSVDITIKRMRKKLGTMAKSIEPIPWVGYRFRDE